MWSQALHHVEDSWMMLINFARIRKSVKLLTTRWIKFLLFPWAMSGTSRCYIRLHGSGTMSFNLWRLHERVKKAETCISKAHQQKGLGTIDLWHDGYNAVYKVLVRHVVGPSMPGSLGSLTFVFFFMYRYVFCKMRPFRVCGIELVRGIRFQFLFPTGLFRFFVSGRVTGYGEIGYSGSGCSCLPLVWGQKKPK